MGFPLPHQMLQRENCGWLSIWDQTRICSMMSFINERDSCATLGETWGYWSDSSLWKLLISHRSKYQWRLETNKPCTTSCPSNPRSASVSVHPVLFMVPLNITCPPLVLPQQDFCLSICICLSWHHSVNQHDTSEKQEITTNHQRIFVVFLSMESQQMELNCTWKAEEYMHLVSKASFMTCPLMWLF